MVKNAHRDQKDVEAAEERSEGREVEASEIVLQSQQGAHVFRGESSVHGRIRKKRRRRRKEGRRAEEWSDAGCGPGKILMTTTTTCEREGAEERT